MTAVLKPSTASPDNSIKFLDAVRPFHNQPHPIERGFPLPSGRAPSPSTFASLSKSFTLVSSSISSSRSSPVANPSFAEASPAPLSLCGTPPLSLSVLPQGSPPTKYPLGRRPSIEGSTPPHVTPVQAHLVSAKGKMSPMPESPVAHGNEPLRLVGFIVEERIALTPTLRSNVPLPFAKPRKEKEASVFAFHRALPATGPTTVPTQVLQQPKVPLPSARRISECSPAPAAPTVEELVMAAPPRVWRASRRP